MNLARSPVDKRLVHKVRDGHVLIADLRRSLPASLPARLFTEDSGLSPEASALLHQCYSQGGTQADCWDLRGYPRSISHGHLARALKGQPMWRNYLKYLHRFYQRDKEKKAYCLHTGPNEIDEANIRRIVGIPDSGPAETDRQRLSEILATVPHIEQEDIFYAQLHFDIHDPYFFARPRDHVPGMLLVEAGRQMMEACCHVFGNVPLSGSAFIWSTLDVSFLQFVDLHMPVKIMGQARELETTADGRWNGFLTDFTMYQWDRPAARMTYGGTILNERGFLRMRSRAKALLDQKPMPRFWLRPGIRHLMSLRGADDQEHPSRIVDISTHGFKLALDQAIPLPTDEGPFQFHMAVEQHGIVVGSARLCWTDPDNQAAGFEIVRISDPDLARLDNIIRLYGFVREDRL